MFVDETEIEVSSGRGGDGLVSFRREKYVPRGGPDGGDGGRGGNVLLRATVALTTLAHVQHGRHYRAGDGRPGGASNCQGKSGADLVLELPVGTLVWDAERGHLLRDLALDGDEVPVVTGGEGGRGNRSFASSINQAPRRATSGEPGRSRRLRLELRLVADVGLVGLPNAGKSTFLRRVTAARPKVADYPFTTLEPVLGLVVGDDVGLVLADLPGLIEGAHAGAGLGDRFLRHVARTKVLLHLVDAQHGPDRAPEAWRTVQEELRLSGLGLETRPVVTAVSRADTVEDPAGVAEAVESVAGPGVLVLSAQTGRGVAEVLARLHQVLAALPPPPGGKSSGPPASKL